MPVIWSGVYSRLEEVPAEGEGFAGNRWLSNCLKRVQDLKKVLAPSCGVPRRPRCTESLLPLAAAMVCSEKGSVRVLDFGGGLGEAYLLTRAGLPAGAELAFDILEVPEVCEAGRSLYGANGPSFLDEVPEAKWGYDLVHLGSSIHYVSDWGGMVAKLAHQSRRYLVFTDLPAGDIPTYASAQHYYDSSIPVWFFNLDEFVAKVRAQGFMLAWRSTYEGFILGSQQPLPQENFEESYRLGYCCNLLFQKGTP